MQRDHQQRLRVETPGAGPIDVTRRVAEVVGQSGISVGLCVVFIRHTSASLLVQENADPAVLRDMQQWLSDMAPESRAWEHDDEGPDDMPAHARAALLRTSETIPIADGKLLLGTWQAIYLWEHRRAPHLRELVIHVSGTA